MVKEKNIAKPDTVQVTVLDDCGFLWEIVETFRYLEEEMTHQLQADLYQRAETRRLY
jgi:hypothetical protein